MYRYVDVDVLKTMEGANHRFADGGHRIRVFVVLGVVFSRPWSSELLGAERGRCGGGSGGGRRSEMWISGICPIGVIGIPVETRLPGQWVPRIFLLSIHPPPSPSSALAQLVRAEERRFFFQSHPPFFCIFYSSP